MTIDEALTGSDQISQVRATPAGTFWLASIAAEDGRTTLRRWYRGTVEDLTPEASVRSRVMEYGGGAYDAVGELIAYVDDRSRSVLLLQDGEHRVVHAGNGHLRFGGLHLVPGRRLLLAVREDHSASPEARTEIVALDLDGDNTDGGRVLVTGADFYAGITSDGNEIAWFQWDHPNMSWDEASVWRAGIDDPGSPIVVVQSQGVSAGHPLFADDGTLAYVSDASGFWNWTLGDRTWTTDHDCAPPTWVLDRAPVALVDGRLATVEFADARGHLAVWDPTSGEVAHPLEGTTGIESIAAFDGDLFVIAEWADRPATLEHLSATGAGSPIVNSTPIDGAVTPESVWAKGTAGPVHSFFYPVPGAENPPLLVMTHGGPTSSTQAAHDRTRQFWVSRGIAVLDVNYSGSTGFGREYRDRLRGQWGVLDVADVIAAVRHLSDAGRVDADKVVITGGSAGGYTTLQALVTTDVFAAGMSRYGIGDLMALAADTHKAESRYPDGLLGPLPDAEQIWLERSPIHQLDSLSTPMLIMQGTEDKVVPPNQAEAMAEAVRSKGLPVALEMFEGEGHGFRGMAARRRALEAQVSFMEQVLGLEHSTDVPVLEIENL